MIHIRAIWNTQIMRSWGYLKKNHFSHWTPNFCEMQKLVLSTVILQLIPTRGTPTAVKKHDYLTYYRVKDSRG
jgi:hypothetical protein